MNKVHMLTHGLMLSLIVFGATAEAQDLTKEAKIERILALTKADAMPDQMVAQLKAFAASQVSPETSPQQRERFERIQNRMIDLFKTFVERLRPYQIKAYDESLSEEEIDALLAFLESPAGSAWIDKMPLIASQMMIAMQTEMNLFRAEIERITREESTR